MEELDSVRLVDAFIADGAKWIHRPRFQETINIVTVASADRIRRRRRGDPPLKPEDFWSGYMGSLWEKSYAVADGKTPEGQQTRLELMDLRKWWWQNVHDRIYQDPLTGLGFYMSEPPRKDAPYPMPDPLTAGDWVDAVQQEAWWTAARRAGDKTNHASRQLRGWQQVRTAAAPVYEPEIRQVLGAVKTHTDRVAPSSVVTPFPRNALWA